MVMIAVTGQSGYALRESGGPATVMRDSLIVSGGILVEVTPRRGHPLDWIKETSRLRLRPGMTTEAMRHLITMQRIVLTLANVPRIYILPPIFMPRSLDCIRDGL